MTGRAPTFVENSGRRLGIEHEYQLFDGATQLDARHELSQLDIDGAHLDPADPYSMRCRWGGVITADGREAEIATPPRNLGDGGIDKVVDLAEAGGAALAAAIGTTHSLRGYSTHLNVEIEDHRGLAISQLLIQRFAPAIMLLLDRRDSPGLLVRPRYRRLELAGEYARTDRLRDALAFAVGAVLACDVATRSRRARSQLPAPLALRTVVSPQRFGWFVDRRAGGDDLYEHGRSTLLRTVNGAVVRAQDILVDAWQVARGQLSPFAGRETLDRLDAIVDGRAPVRIEANDDPDVPSGGYSVPTDSLLLLDARRRGDIVITTSAATWHAVALRAERAGRVRWIRVPGERIDDFVTALDHGELDLWLAGQFEEPTATSRRT